jgi:hypothetical protein
MGEKCSGMFSFGGLLIQMGLKRALLFLHLNL